MKEGSPDLLVVLFRKLDSGVDLKGMGNVSGLPLLRKYCIALIGG